MKTYLTLASVLALVLAISLAATPQPASAAPSVPDCYVNVDAAFGATPASGSRAVDVVVLPDCSAVVGRPRALTPLEASAGGAAPLAYPQQQCTWANRLIGAGGEGDILTELTIHQTFSYDGALVQSESYNGSTYNHWSTGWGVISSSIGSLSSTPTASYEVDAQASFSWFGQWNHDKTTHSFANGDGSCTGQFWHNGYVCSGCAVRFYIFYY